MKLVEIIEKEHSKRQMEKVVAYVGTSPVRFAELIDLYLSGPYRITQRASWPISNCVEVHPELIKPHLKRMIQFLDKPNIHDAVKRNTVRFLQFIEIPKALKGKVADLCFEYLTSGTEPIGIKVTAMTVLTNLATEFPDLKNELIPIIESQLPYSSAGFRSRALKSLKALKS